MYKNAEKNQEKLLYRDNWNPGGGKFVFCHNGFD